MDVDRPIYTVRLAPKMEVASAANQWLAEHGYEYGQDFECESLPGFFVKTVFHFYDRDLALQFRLRL